MRRFLRISSPLSQLAVLLLLLGGAFALTSAISLAVLVSKGINMADLKHFDFSDPKTLGVLKLIQGISTICIFLLPALLFAFIAFRFRQFYFLGFRKQERGSFYIIAVVIVVFVFPFVGWLGELNEHIPLSKWMIESEKEAGRQMGAFLKMSSTSDVVINILLVALLPAICEEVFFRGCVQRILIQLFKSPWSGIVITAALFSAFHMEFAGFLPRMFLGILLGALFWYGNSLWINIIAHFFYNGIQVIAVLWDPKIASQNPSVPVYAALISGIIVFSLLYVVKKQSTVTYAKVYEMDEVNETNQFIV
ncbi:MAG: CPBP family intramembrane metalloprotease [Bacteroidetes bacterium]|nr:CPBP family intramembrane metalloprotease [Bacteroidota bacterium]MBS1973074.1 CPBP family intramembrane metalloprotease [Bacteroidota bacterium]